MKRSTISACAALTAASISSVSAQSTGQLMSRLAYSQPSQQSAVTIYGIIDTSVGYLSNSGGGQVVALQSAKQAPNFFGFTGTENLGRGSVALFKIEQTLLLNSGTTIPRESYVGLSNERVGTATLGRQADFSSYFTRFTGGRFANSVDTMHLGNIDGVAGRIINNSIIYRSPVWGPIEAAAMYSFGDSGAGTTNMGRVVQGLVSFVHGPLSGVIVYEGINGITLTPYSFGVPYFFGRTMAPTTNVFVEKSDFVSAGLAYQIGKVNIHGVYSRDKLQTGNASQTLITYDTGVGWTVAPDTFVGLNYSYTSLSGSSGVTPHWNLAGLAVDYFLSKRTDLFLDAAYERASGLGYHAAFPYEVPSSTNTQASVRVGIRHFF